MLKIDVRDREKLIDPLFRVGWRFWLLISILLILIGWGVFMYIRQIRLGLGQTGMNRPVYWGVYMVNFIFFIGISHAGTLISAILRITNAEWRRPITRIAEAITAFALIVGTLQIIIDIGHPDRLLFVFAYGRLQSPILWDVVSVTVYFLSSVIYLYLPLIPDAAILRDNLPENAPAWRRILYRILAVGWQGNVEQWRRLEKAIGFMAIFIVPVAISVHTIISWILATTVQPGWHTAIFGPYFVVGAIFSGIGALFIAMTLVRQVLGLADYIKLRQFRNLGFLFITMNIVWMYFTFTESLILAAGQQSMEFPVLASKLWGEFSFGFWIMLCLMFGALLIQVMPLLLSDSFQRRLALRLPYLVGAVILATILSLLLTDPNLVALLTSMNKPDLYTLGWVLVAFIVTRSILGISFWLKQHTVITLVTAGSAVLIGMWLERWILVVPTLTHPRLIRYTSYFPTLTEISLTIASAALFVLMFVLFFKLFPAVSIWEVAEGRVIDKTYENITIPVPEPSGLRYKKGRLRA
jgi:molybdopterin-containing oxidoreductase family membrane subunit